MVKKSSFTTGAKRAALIVTGWACFMAGVLVTDPIAKLSLLAIARVLP
jgi:hypothetical protein